MKRKSLDLKFKKKMFKKIYTQFLCTEILIYFFKDIDKESKSSSSALKKSGRYRSRSLSASSSDSYSSGESSYIFLKLNFKYNEKVILNLRN